MKRIGPYSRPHTLAKLDGRSREARLLQNTRDDFIRHVGGTPSVAQLAMIDRAAWLSLHLSMMDAKILEGGDAVLTDRDGRQYLAWANTLNRLLRDIGLNGKPQVPQKTLQDIIAEHAA